MRNAIYNFPIPNNEPVKAYLKGSPEREALEAELKRQTETVLDIPIIIGGLGDYLAECKLLESLKNYDKINEALKSVVSKIPNCAFVSAKGLTSNDDFLHFNTKSLNEFGGRYFEAFKNLNKRNNS